MSPAAGTLCDFILPSWDAGSLRIRAEPHRASFAWVSVSVGDSESCCISSGWSREFCFIHDSHDVLAPLRALVQKYSGSVEGSSRFLLTSCVALGFWLAFSGLELHLKIEGGGLLAKDFPALVPNTQTSLERAFASSQTGWLASLWVTCAFQHKQLFPLKTQPAHHAHDHGLSITESSSSVRGTCASHK